MARNAEQTLRRRLHPRYIPMDESAASGDLRKCLQEMRVANPRDIISDIKMQKGKRVGNTCEWILKRKELLAWGACGDPELLRLVGSPGIGKTMMSTFLVEALREKVEKSLDSAFAYFFCDDKNQDRKTPTAILRSLVWQLLLQKKELFRHIQPDFDKHQDSRRFDDLFDKFSALWRIFQDMLLDMEAGEVFIVIDALDECDKSTRKGLLQNIKDFFRDLRKSGRKVKFLITCRPEIPDIEGALKRVGISLRIDDSHINNDLSDYISIKTNELAEEKDYELSMKKEVLEALRTNSGGTFLWVSLMIAELGDVHKFQVRDKLKSLPRGLDEVYASILNRVPDDKQEVAKFVLHFMVAAERPLTRIEIQTAFASSSAANGNTSAAFYPDLRVYNDIFSACSSILYVPNSGEGDRAQLNFCHQSVKDFLLSDSSPERTKWYHTTIDDANYLIFDTCWGYLCAEDCKLANLIYSRREVNGRVKLHEMSSWDLQSHSPEYPFLEYAQDHWRTHGIASQIVLLKPNGFRINVTDAPALRDAWLLQTAREGKTLLLRLLIERGANLNIVDNENQPPILYAIMNRDETAVKLLLECGKVDPNSEDDSNLTPLWYAIGEDDKAIVKLLLESGKVDPNLPGGKNATPLFCATVLQHEAIVKLLLESGKVDPNPKDRTNRTPLSRAAYDGHEAIVKLFLEYGKVDPNSKDRINQTPLHYAVMNRDEAVVKLLLDNGKVDPDSKDISDGTPLLYAAQNGHEAIVKLLLDTDKVDPDSKNINNETPLSLAAMYGHEGVVKLLQSRS